MVQHPPHDLQCKAGPSSWSCGGGSAMEEAPRERPPTLGLEDQAEKMMSMMVHSNHVQPLPGQNEPVSTFEPAKSFKFQEHPSWSAPSRALLHGMLWKRRLRQGRRSKDSSWLAKFLLVTRISNNNEASTKSNDTSLIQVGFCKAIYQSISIYH